MGGFLDPARSNLLLAAPASRPNERCASAFLRAWIKEISDVMRRSSGGTCRRSKLIRGDVQTIDEARGRWRDKEMAEKRLIPMRKRPGLRGLVFRP